jgi:hypothetical protein
MSGWLVLWYCDYFTKKLRGIMGVEDHIVGELVSEFRKQASGVDQSVVDEIALGISSHSVDSLALLERMKVVAGIEIVLEVCASSSGDMGE